MPTDTTDLTSAEQRVLEALAEVKRATDAYVTAVQSERGRQRRWVTWMLTPGTCGERELRGELYGLLRRLGGPPPSTTGSTGESEGA